ncbi:uncharacterized protein LOC116852955, partial [Odontomachus brunneus]|uniref:uncharacterized protein LOC116852955 n=1 Tax=Odontomachus brunneus TaxID=486640 RepID=UPI0013F1E2D0
LHDVHQENYEHDINYTYELNRFVFSFLGIWPYVRTNFWILQKLQRVPLFFVFYLLLCSDLISTLLYIFMVQKETRARIKVIAGVLFTIVSLLKYSNFFYLKNPMKSCMMCVEKDFQSVINPTARNTMLFHVRTSRRLCILCSIFMYGAGLTYRTLIPLTRGKIVTAQNITIRPLPNPAYYISPAYDCVLSTVFGGSSQVHVHSGRLRHCGALHDACCGAIGHLNGANKQPNNRT